MGALLYGSSLYFYGLNSDESAAVDGGRCGRGSSEDRFHVRILDFDCDGSLDQGHGQHYAGLPPPAYKNSFQAFEGPASDSDPAPRLKIWKRFRHRRGCQTLKIFDLTVQDRDRFSLKADEVHHARKTQQFKFSLDRDLHEDIAGKQRELKALPAILPAPHRSIEWNQGPDSALLELVRDVFLVTRSRIRHEPRRDVRGDWSAIRPW
jgi:hypothetical protein